MGLENIITEVDTLFKHVSMNFENSSWRKAIPGEPGWYMIATNAPINLLESVGPPEYPAHINIPQSIKNSTALRSLRISIAQASNEDWVVYNGETNNLKARAREHQNGHPRTYCLGLSSYEPLRRYRWRFSYTPVSSCKTTNSTGKLLRLAVEQGWRVKHGWPVLCSK